MRERVGKIEKERVAPSVPDEANRLGGIALGERLLDDRLLDDLLVAHERHGRILPSRVVHVVAVGDPEVAIEPMPRGQIPRQVPEVPLADASRLVAAGLERLGERQLLRLDAILAVREQHPREPGPNLVPSSEQGGPRRRAHRRRHVELGQLYAFGRHPIEVRRLNPCRAEAPEIAVAQVVGEKQHDVRRAGCRRGDSRTALRQKRVDRPRLGEPQAQRQQEGTYAQPICRSRDLAWSGAGHHVMRHQCAIPRSFPCAPIPNRRKRGNG